MKFVVIDRPKFWGFVLRRMFGIKKQPVMIFDDSFSAIDARTDAAIRRNLKSAVKGASVILISHRIATLMQADQIFVFQNGKIVQQGTHQELAGVPGIYRQICEIQSVLPEGGESHE